MSSESVWPPQFNFQMLDRLHNRCGEWDDVKFSEEEIADIMKATDNDRKTAIGILREDYRKTEQEIETQLPEINL